MNKYQRTVMLLCILVCVSIIKWDPWLTPTLKTLFWISACLCATGLVLGKIVDRSRD